MLAQAFTTIPGTTQYHEFAKYRKIGEITLKAVPRTITFFLPILSASMPPGSWNRILLVFWIVARKPMITGETLSTLRR